MPNTKLATIIDTLYPRAQRLAVLLFILIALLLVVLTNPANGDELTGQPQDDPKDLAPAPPPTLTLCSTSNDGFQALPSWARASVMPALPDKLLPMGRKVVVLTTPPTAAPLAPPKEASATPEVTEAKSKPAPASPSPALIAVSPFLQWIQSNPDAATQARQQANAYRPAPSPETPVVENGANTPTGATPPAPAHAPAPVDPYWLPPLIDAAPFGVQTGSSAAIYTTPQR